MACPLCLSCVHSSFRAVYRPDSMLLWLAAASFSQHAPQITHGAMYSSIIDSQAKKLKQAEAMSNNLAYGRLVFEVRTHCPVFAIVLLLPFKVSTCSSHSIAVGWHCTYMTPVLEVLLSSLDTS